MIAAATNQDALLTPAEPSPTPHSNALVRTLRADQRTAWHDHDLALHDDSPGNDGDGDDCLSRSDWIPVPGTSGLGRQWHVPGHTGFGGYAESASLDEAALDAGPDPNAAEQP